MSHLHDRDFLDMTLGGIDLDMLRGQKLSLVKVLDTLDGREEEDLEGILNLLDAIQDFMEDHPENVRSWQEHRATQIKGV